MEKDWANAIPADGNRAQSNAEEKRIHKEDKTKKPYTYKEFVAFGMGNDWESAIRVDDGKSWDKKGDAKDAKWGGDKQDARGGQSWDKKDAGKDAKWGEENWDKKGDSKDGSVRANSSKAQSGAEEKRIH